MSQHFLSRLFNPRSIAVFGASDRQDSVGMLVFHNLIEGNFTGKVYAINPKHTAIQGQKAYANIEEIVEPIELAVITTPATTIPAIIDACGRKGVRAAVIISAGFRETGEKGKHLEHQVLESAHRYGLRFIGPNCLGIIRPQLKMNATFDHSLARPGKLALVSQSGAVCSAILDWAHDKNIGFSNIISMGNAADVNFGDVLDYLVSDPETDSILLYIEGIWNARKFLSSLRAAARVKPIIALKVGRHQSSLGAVMSHSGSLVGGDDVFTAALKRAGVVRATRIGNLFAAASTLSSHFRTQGNQLLIVTNGGGPGVMAADTAGDLGISMAQLSSVTIEELNTFLPSNWSRGNPLDIIGDAQPDRYERTLQIVLTDPNVDGVLVILTPQAMTKPTAVAQTMIQVATTSKKPILSCWMGESLVNEGRKAMANAGIPSFNTPEAAVEAFSYLVHYRRNQQLLLQTPESTSQKEAPDVEGAKLIIEGALAEDRKLLTEIESKALLTAFHIPCIPTVAVTSPFEALVQAEAFGFPVVMKIHSPQITHKSDVGGVRLNIRDAQSVRPIFNEMIAKVKKASPEANIYGVLIEKMHQSANARELIIGLATDPVFGPIIAFGAGGQNVEIVVDRAVALPPLNKILIEELIAGTKISKSLRGYRHVPPANLAALEEVLLRVSEIACELPQVRELDINPLLLDADGAMAADARIVIDFAPVTADRYAHVAIHPYPAHLITHCQLGNGINIVIRPIRPEDAGIEQEFVRALSERSRYFRFISAFKELTPQMLARFTQIDYDREMSFVAVLEQPPELEVGVASYIINPDGHSCEFAMVVADDWHHRGIGHRLMQQLITTARGRGLSIMEGEVRADNNEMLNFVRGMGFTITHDPDDDRLMIVSLRLRRDE